MYCVRHYFGEPGLEELDYGLVYVVKGRHKGRILYYDDDDTPKTAICYAGHPLDFVSTFGIPKKCLRVTTIDDLLAHTIRAMFV